MLKTKLRKSRTSLLEFQKHVSAFEPFHQQGFFKKQKC